MLWPECPKVAGSQRCTAGIATVHHPRIDGVGWPRTVFSHGYVRIDQFGNNDQTSEPVQLYNGVQQVSLSVGSVRQVYGGCTGRCTAGSHSVRRCTAGYSVRRCTASVYSRSVYNGAGSGPVSLYLLLFVGWSPVGLVWPVTAHPWPLSMGIIVTYACQGPPATPSGWTGERSSPIRAASLRYGIRRRIPTLRSFQNGSRNPSCQSCTAGQYGRS